MLGIVCLSPLQMLCTTSPFLTSYGLATCLPVVLTSPQWLVINDWNRFCDNDAPRLRSSWMRPRVGVLRWHSNSSCSLLVFLSLVPTNFFVFCLAVLVQLDIYLSGLCSILPYVSIVFLLQHGTRESKSVSREGEVFLQKFTYHLGHGCCPVLFLPPFLYAVEYCLPTFLFVLRQRRWS